MKKTFMIFFILIAFGMNIYSQFGENKFSDNGDPEINYTIDFEHGLINIIFNMDENFHITDLKEGFFNISISDNNNFKIGKLIFPEGVDFKGDKVFKGNFTVKVYIKQIKKISDPVNLNFIISYQICKERPVEMCFAPAEQNLKIEINNNFKKYKLKSDKKQEIKNKEKKISKNTNNKDELTPKATSLSPNLLFVFSLILLAFAVFFGLFTPFDDDDIKEKLKKALLIIIFITGAFMFVKYLEFDGNNNISNKEHVELTWVKNIDLGRELARKDNKKIMIDTFADWCVACKELDEFTFSNPDVAKILKEKYILVKLDFTKKNKKNSELKEELKIIGMPTVIFLDKSGKELKRFSGFYNKERFLDFIDSKTGFFDRMILLLKKELDKKSLILFFLIFGLGFLTSLTPCVYPVIPIVMGFVGTKSGGKKLKGFYLSIFFVLGLSFVYSILGVIAGATGSMMGVSFQNPVIVIIISLIFVIMGLSMAGLFDIPVPSSISSKMQGGNKGEIIGSIIIGGVAGVIAAPCVGPVLIALLSWISQTGNIFLGFLLTFVFSLGMGVIFLLVGTFSGLVSALPKGGKWMENIKYFFSAILVAGGIFILNPVIPAWTSSLLWGIYLIALSVFLGVLKILVESNLKEKLIRLIVLLIFIYGIFLFFKSADKGYYNKDIKQKIETGWLKK